LRARRGKGVEMAEAETKQSSGDLDVLLKTEQTFPPS
jgi:hypothetical protein